MACLMASGHPQRPDGALSAASSGLYIHCLYLMAATYLAEVIGYAPKCKAPQHIRHCVKDKSSKNDVSATSRAIEVRRITKPLLFRYLPRNHDALYPLTASSVLPPFSNRHADATRDSELAHEESSYSSYPKPGALMHTT